MIISSGRRRLAAAAALVAALTLPLVARADAGAATTHPTAILSKKVIGHSVLGRPIVAYRLGDATAPRSRTMVVIGEMHGDEHAGVTVADSIIRGTSSVEGIALWVIPTMNPDGDARHTRQNAHGVDLNRNFPINWAHLTGQYYSGTKPLSEPESRAVAVFLRDLRPHFVVSLHQPLDGVDTTAGSGPAYEKYRLALGRNLGLPQKALKCWSVCHGSMSAWFAHYRFGVAVETVEFGWTPARSYLTGQARTGIIAALGGHFGKLSAHNPRFGVRITATSVTGWTVDRDVPTHHPTYDVTRDGRLIAHRVANASAHAGHGISYRLPAVTGRHRYCVTIANLGAGTTDPVTCATVAP